MTKYCDNSDYGYNGYFDNMTTLLPEDDPATANWGGDWRTPTFEEWQELLNNTTVTYETHYTVKCIRFTAANGRSIFLPAAGVYDDSGLIYPGSEGDYWSSSLTTGNPDRAWYLGFFTGHCSMYNYQRYYGRSVRPVRTPRRN